MAMKKAAKKGDEPVRMGRAKTQRTKGILKDPYGYTSGKNMNKDVAQEVANRMRVGKQKYGTNYVVEVSMDGVVRTKAGASRKAQKAQSSRMTAQAKSSKSSRSTNDLAGRSGKGFIEGYGAYDSAGGRTSRRETNQGKRSAVKKAANTARVVKQKQR